MPLGGKIFGVKRYPTHTKAWALKMRLWDIKMGTFPLENESCKFCRLAKRNLLYEIYTFEHDNEVSKSKEQTFGIASKRLP